MLASNLQFLRKKHRMTQEDLAQRLGVSRQTISKWESSDVLPELTKAVQLSEIFFCSLDSLLKEDLVPREQNALEVIRLAPFRLAQYPMLSPNARQDAMDYIARWAARNALDAELLGWPFPYVSEKQKETFGLRGYVGACVVPEDFTDAAVEISRMEEAHYVVLTCRIPSDSISPDFSWAVPRILEYMQTQGIRKKIQEGTLPCFQRQFPVDGNLQAEYYIQCEGAEPSRIVTF